MKFSVAALFILMVMAFRSSLASTSLMSSMGPVTCCFSYVKIQIARKYVTGYFETSGYCPQPGVVFLLKKKRRQICANPKDAWVQNYVNGLKLKTL